MFTSHFVYIQEITILSFAFLHTLTINNKGFAKSLLKPVKVFPSTAVGFQSFYILLLQNRDILFF